MSSQTPIPRDPFMPFNLIGGQMKGSPIPRDPGPLGPPRKNKAINSTIKGARRFHRKQELKRASNLVESLANRPDFDNIIKAAQDYIEKNGQKGNKLQVGAGGSTGGRSGKKGSGGGGGRMGALRQDLRQDIRQQNQLYRAGKGDINYVHGEVADYLRNMTRQMNQGYGQTRQGVNQLGSQLIQQLQSGTNQARSAATAEQERLGIQQAGMGQFDVDANNNTMVARQGSADVLQNLATGQLGANNVAALLGGMNQGSRASGLGQILNQRNAGINEARDAFRDARMQARLEARARRAAAAQYSRGGYGGYGYSSGGSGSGVTGDPSYVNDLQMQLQADKLAKQYFNPKNYFTNADGQNMLTNPNMQGPMVFDPIGQRGPKQVKLGKTGYTLDSKGNYFKGGDR